MPAGRGPGCPAVCVVVQHPRLDRAAAVALSVPPVDRTHAAPTELLDANPAPTDELVVVEDDTQITLTRNEALAEAGELLDLWNAGYTAPEVARLLGVTKQRVHQICRRLGGVLFPTSRRGRWRYPRGVVDAEVARRHERS